MPSPIENWLLGDHYVIALDDAVTDVEGNPLNGEWVNPVSLFTTNSAVSHFPSGDGDVGGDFNFVMTLMGGDFTLNNIVDWDDESLFWDNVFLSIPSPLFTDADSNGDGVVDFWDDPPLYLTHGLNLQAVWILADLNGDYAVDDLDRDILFNNYLLNLSNPTKAQGDLNSDGAINIHDLDLMFAQYGLELNVVS